jgi:hypothetical protein
VGNSTPFAILLILRMPFLLCDILMRPYNFICHADGSTPARLRISLDWRVEICQLLRVKM